jgi:hypothetical protein
MTSKPTEKQTREDVVRLLDARVSSLTDVGGALYECAHRILKDDAGAMRVAYTAEFDTLSAADVLALGERLGQHETIDISVDLKTRTVIVSVVRRGSTTLANEVHAEENRKRKADDCPADSYIRQLMVAKCNIRKEDQQDLADKISATHAGFNGCDWKILEGTRTAYAVRFWPSTPARSVALRTALEHGDVTISFEHKAINLHVTRSLQSVL